VAIGIDPFRFAQKIEFHCRKVHHAFLNKHRSRLFGLKLAQATSIFGFRFTAATPNAPRATEVSTVLDGRGLISDLCPRRAQEQTSSCFDRAATRCLILHLAPNATLAAGAY
jgi:hypothetical protein